MEDGKVFFFKRGAISCSLREKFQIQTQTYIYIAHADMGMGKS